MTTKHTPGPWMYGYEAEDGTIKDVPYGECEDCYRNPRIFGSDGELVAGSGEYPVTHYGEGISFQKDPQAWRARDIKNIALIVAAPELLEALSYARRFMNADQYDLEFIDAALVKAKGEMK
jgi:hypothetical protein